MKQSLFTLALCLSTFVAGRLSGPEPYSVDERLTAIENRVSKLGLVASSIWVDGLANDCRLADAFGLARANSTADHRLKSAYHEAVKVRNEVSAFHETFVELKPGPGFNDLMDSRKAQKELEKKD